MIDMTTLFCDEPVAVHFQCEAEAREFFTIMKDCYPTYVRRWNTATYKSDYLEYGGVCYCPYFNEVDGSMTHASRWDYEEFGYPVVEYSDLIVSALDENIGDDAMKFLFD